MPSEKLEASNALIWPLLKYKISLVPMAAICSLVMVAICAVESSLMSDDDKSRICVVDKY